MKISASLIKYCLFLIPYFSSSIISISLFLWIVRVVSIIIFILFFVEETLKDKKWNVIDYLIMSISLWILIISLYNHTINVTTLYLLYSWFAICFIANHSIQNNNIEFIKACCYLLNIFVILNIPFILNNLSVDVYDRFYIFGGKNQVQLFLIPSVFANYVLSYIRYGRLKKMYLLFILLDIIEILMSGASTGIFTIAFCGILFIIQRFKRINFGVYTFILILALILIFNTDYILKIDILYNFIINVLHKNLTFTARSKIWLYCWSFISSKLIGYGYGNNVINSYFSLLNECHNMFLELLLIGGLPLLILFVIILYKLLKNNPSKFSNSLYPMCFSFFIIGLTESIQFQVLFWIMLIIYYKISNSEILIRNVEKKGE